MLTPTVDLVPPPRHQTLCRPSPSSMPCHAVDLTDLGEHEKNMALQALDEHTERAPGPDEAKSLSQRDAAQRVYRHRC